MFAGCTSKHPVVTITYTFRDREYAVEYELSRLSAPQTVQHFIELADAGYYDGTVIHDYQSDGFFLYGGGYTLDGNGELVEKDYWSELMRLEKEKGITFTQTVFAKGADMSAYFRSLSGDYVAGGVSYTVSDEKIPLYTLHGEFNGNGVLPNQKSYRQNVAGTLVMYYMEKGTNSTPYVGSMRTDGGDNNNGEAYQPVSSYRTNSATSLFYTFTASGDRTDLDENYCAFGRTMNFSQLQALLDAIGEYAESMEDGFTEEREMRLNQHDPMDAVRNGGFTATYQVPREPITVKSVKVNKY